MKQYTNDQQNEFSKVTIVSVDRDFYMDDFLKSDECVKDLISVTTQLLQLLFNKDFRLTEEISNKQIILDKLSSTELRIH